MEQEVEIHSGDIIEIPIFPLPNVVFFPNTVFPLHIFEPRYRQMTADALERNRQIGMCLLKYGCEDPTQPSNDSYVVGGLGVISEVRQHSDGRYDLLLAGMSRFRVLSLTQSQPYRCARVVLLQDTAPPSARKVQIASRLLETYSELATFREDTSELESLAQVDFHSLINLLCMSVNVGVHSKQSLLEIDALEKRGRSVLHILQSLIQQERVVKAFKHLRPGDPSAN